MYMKLLLGQKPTTTGLRLHYMSFQLVLMYKQSTVTVHDIE